MASTRFPNGIVDGTIACTHAVASVVNGAGTVTPTSPTLPAGSTATLAGFNATINSGFGTAVAAPMVVGGSITATTVVLSLKDNAGGTVAGTATVGYSAWFTVA